ncbi:hypothetical protein MRX96_019867 [Rhipicephalus microplus]
MRTCLESTMRRMHLTPQKLLVPFGPEIFAAWFADFALRRTQSPVLPKINVPTFAGYTTMIWQCYAPAAPSDVTLEPACAWTEQNAGTVPSHCPWLRPFVVGLDRDLRSLGPTSGNPPR